MLSIVVPVFNEEESLPHFYNAILKVLPTLDKKYEILFIDDGSTDRSLNLLKGFVKKNKRVKIFSFRKNQGKAEALTLGFQKAKGSYIVTLDADLQDKPNEIHKLLIKIKQGYGLACGWRKNRKDAFKHVISSKFFNIIVGILWGLRLHDYNCGLKAYTSEAAKSISIYGSLHRFIPLLIYQEGFKVCEVPVDHEKRKYGKSKYGFSKLWKDIPDMFTMFFLSKYGSRPLHFFGFAGGSMFLAGFSCLLYLAIIHSQGEAIATRPLFFFGIILLLGGFQVFFTGFLADLLINVSKPKERVFALKYSSK